MNLNRWINVGVAAALAGVALLTARQAAATAEVVAAACTSAASVSAVYADQGGGWVAQVDGHAVGVDGGLLALEACAPATAQTGAASECPFTPEWRAALRAAYAPLGGGWVAQADGRATGVDGGLLALRGCPAD